MLQFSGNQHPAFLTKDKFVGGGTAMVPVNVVASAFQAKIPASRRRTAAVIPTDNLRILNPPIVLEERGSLNQKRGLIGKVQELSCRSHEVVAPTPLTRIH